jgi:hypothetical protein
LHYTSVADAKPTYLNTVYWHDMIFGAQKTDIMKMIRRFLVWYVQLFEMRAIFFLTKT